MLANSTQPRAEGDPAKGGAAKPTGGKYGRLPNAIAVSDLSPEAKFLVAYRCLHSDGKSRWGCQPGKMREAASQHFSRKVFQRAIREAVEAGYLERTRGPKKRANADPRGRGRAIDSLTFDPPDADYVKVQRADFDGSLTPKEFTAKLYLDARGDCLSCLWQIQKCLGVTRPTVNKVMKSLSARGLATNYGTKQNPQWGTPGLKKATFKKATLKKGTLKKATPLRTTTPLRTISPLRSTNTQDAQTLGNKEDGSNRRAAVAATTPSFGNTKRTDEIGSIAAAITAAAVQADGAKGSATAVLGKRQLITDRTLTTVHLLGVDPEEMLDRLYAAVDKGAAQGRPIADSNAYMLQMARREAEKNGVKVDTVEDLTSPNEWKRGAALAKAVGAPLGSLKAPIASLPDEPQLKRIAAQLVRAGFVPAEVERLWADAYRSRATKMSYPQFADAQRMNARHPGASLRRAVP